MTVDRRTFLRLVASGLASAALPLMGCAQGPEQYGLTQLPTPDFPMTPNESWYFVGAQGVYEADARRYRVKIGGLVRKALSLSVAELKERYERVVQADTLACVGDRPNGVLMSSSYFAGVRLKDVLDDAGVDRRATMVLTTGLDGFVALRGLEDLVEDTTMLAFEMGTEPDALVPLRIEQGFPLRLLTPGRYGYLQPKWLDALTFVDDSDTHAVLQRSLDYFDGKLQLSSGFTNPFDGWLLDAGPQEVTGYAFGDGRPIARVEVLAEGRWQAAEIVWNTVDDELPGFVWCLWRMRWEAPVGVQTLAVRATYSDGQTQFTGRDFPYSGGSIVSITVDVRRPA